MSENYHRISYPYIHSLHFLTGILWRRYGNMIGWSGSWRIPTFESLQTSISISKTFSVSERHILARQASSLGPRVASTPIRFPVKHSNQRRHYRLHCQLFGAWQESGDPQMGNERELPKRSKACAQCRARKVKCTQLQASAI